MCHPVPSETTSKFIHSFRPNGVPPRLGKANFERIEKACKVASVINSHATAQGHHDPNRRSFGVGGGTQINTVHAFDAYPAWGSPHVETRMDGNPVREVGTTELWLPAA
jgi:hypothetical protein